jgi:uncharacterized protein (TIGR02145 family)
MKKLIFYLTLVIAFNVKAQNDTMYIFYNGEIVGQRIVSKIDSIIFYKTNSYQTITDIEGNLYNVITLGTQTWMRENLKTTRYRNGDLIGTTNPANLNISGEATPKYQWAYGGDENNAATYGRMYTWYAITDSRGVCPSGFHIPSDEEWTTLEIYLQNNGFNYDGTIDTDNDRTTNNKISKSVASKSGWSASSIPGSIGNTDFPSYKNKSNFTALPGGQRIYSGSFFGIGNNTIWWSSTTSNGSYAWNRGIFYNSAVIDRSSYANCLGYYIRCIKD